MQLPVHFWCFVAIWFTGFVFTLSIFNINDKNGDIEFIYSIFWPFMWLFFWGRIAYKYGSTKYDQAKKF